MSSKKDTAKSAKPTADKSKGFTAEERSAMQERAKELKAEARASKDRAEGEKAVLAAIAQMKDPDQSMAQRLHEIITASAPNLMPKTWYGMPAYANADGKIICFYQSAQKFNTRYATLGFQHDAHLDDGNMWATSFALLKLTSAVEAKIKALVKQAVN